MRRTADEMSRKLRIPEKPRKPGETLNFAPNTQESPPQIGYCLNNIEKKTKIAENRRKIENFAGILPSATILQICQNQTRTRRNPNILVKITPKHIQTPTEDQLDTRN